MKVKKAMKPQDTMKVKKGMKPKMAMKSRGGAAMTKGALAEALAASADLKRDQDGRPPGCAGSNGICSTPGLCGFKTGRKPAAEAHCCCAPAISSEVVCAPTMSTDQTPASKLIRICNPRWATQGTCEQCNNRSTVYPASGAWKNTSYCRRCWFFFLQVEAQSSGEASAYTDVCLPSPYRPCGYTGILDALLV